MKCCATLQGLLRIPGIFGAALPLLWVVFDAPRLYGSQDGGIRFSLTVVFTLLILFRRQRPMDDEHPGRIGRTGPHGAWLATAALLGAAAVVTGLIVPIRQVEWIGLLLVAYACLAFTLPRPLARNLPAALFVFYWANPLPSALFGALQTGMQQASVLGSEWLLHLVNTRVWADGMILHTGTRIFEVPAWCSGMRTATTVFILSLAVGILRRLKPAEILVFIGWSLVHALALNILRISAMVYFAPLLADTAGLGFLHDTAGLIVIAGVLLVYIELLVLEHARRRRHRLRGMLQAAREGGLSEYPPFWHRFLRRRSAIFASLALLALGGLVAWRSRPYHRTMMLRDVVLTLRDRGDMANAQRLAAIVSDRLPAEDLEWRFTTIRLDLISGDPQRALDELDAMEDLPAGLQLQRRILQAYALLSLGRLEEAVAIVAELPEAEQRRDPRVAMILAEMALRRGDSTAVAEHVIAAGQWAPNAGRIRKLYPFLRIHRQWDAMAATDVRIPYDDPVQAFSILEAFMHLNNVPRVAGITLEVLGRLPDDPRLLEPLYFMTLQSGAEWETRFRDHLLRTLPGIGEPETLYEMLYKCFDLARPDLAWRIYRRIAEIDPDHPLLHMAAVEYGARWFVFRRHYLGLPAGNARETIDLKPFYILGSMLPEWRELTQSVPLGALFAVADTVPVRKALLQQCIPGFAAREQLEMPPVDLQYLHAQALERAGRLDLARAKLDAIVSQYPQEAEAARELLAEMYERKGSWVQVYETLRTYLLETPGLAADDIPAGTPGLEDATRWPPVPVALRADTERIHLPPLLRLGEAQLKLHLPLAALFTAREAVRLYPYAPRAQALLANALLRTGEAEEALKRLGSTRTRNLRELDQIEAEALRDTERFSLLESFCRSRLLPPVTIPSDTVQNTSLPPAEISLLWHRTQIPSETEFAATAATLRRNLEMAGEGLRPLFSLWLETWEKPGSAPDIARWAATGRDRIEQATALNQLTLLLCHESRFPEALPVARAAVAALPDSAHLWRILISLSSGDPELVALARLSCPDDAEIWLADLVTRTRPDGAMPQTEADRDRAREHIATLIDEAGRFHPAARTRAAEYCWRGGLRDAAERLTRDLPGDSRGLLPACIADIRSALHVQDKQRALRSTSMAINAAIAPVPALHENLVLLKNEDGTIDTDSDMVNSLRVLRKADPRNPLWPQMLGYVRFQRGGWEILDAMFEMNTAIDGGATNRTPFLISAEVSRLLRHYDRAADTLRRGLVHHPGHPDLLNNLAYVLAQIPARVPEAAALLPALETAATETPAILDTIAVVHLRTGQPELARQTLIRMLNHAEPGSPLWFRAQTHLAEIAWLQGKDQTAISMLEQLLKGSRNIPDEDILTANALFNQITTKRSGPTGLE